MRVICSDWFPASQASACLSHSRHSLKKKPPVHHCLQPTNCFKQPQSARGLLWARYITVSLPCFLQPPVSITTTTARKHRRATLHSHCRDIHLHLLFWNNYACEETKWSLEAVVANEKLCAGCFEEYDKFSWGKRLARSWSPSTIHFYMVKVLTWQDWVEIRVRLSSW